MAKKIFTILAAVVFVLGLQAARAETGHKHEGTAAVQQSTVKQAVNAGNEICPVSGEKIDEKMKATYEYEGKVYSFCCAMCIEEFKKDPEKYIKKVEEELEDESKEQSGQREEEMEMMKESGAFHQGTHQGHHH